MHIVDGSKIARFRGQQHLSQMELATMADSAPTYISNLENNSRGVDCTVSLAYRLATSLGKKIEDILTEINV